MKDKHIMLCLPGRKFSGEFLESWTEVVLSAAAKGYRLSFNRKYTPVVITTRNNLLGGYWMNGADQKTYNGTVEYDYTVWFDDDVVYSWDLIKELITERDIMSGWYATKSRTHTSVIEKKDPEYRKEHGRWPQMTVEEMNEKKGIFPAEIVGFGCIAINRGVFEDIGYPWFEPLPRVEHNGVTTYMADDESFCHKAMEKGYKIWVNPEIRVGHEKNYVVQG